MRYLIRDFKGVFKKTHFCAKIQEEMNHCTAESGTLEFKSV